MIEETGVGIKNPLWFVGVVERRDDPRKEGRVQVRAFGVHGTNAQVPTEDLPWAICISGNYDPNYPIPPLNAWVFGFFIDGRDAQQPMILGLIPTQMTSLIDPEANGWGVIPTENVNLQSQGSRAIDYGQPMNSRKGRGEELEKTDVLFQEVNRVSADFTSLEEGFVIEEPPPGSQPVYPFNRVTETAAGHSLELDDSPGAERVRLGHAGGAYVEMHQNGVVVLKSMNDLFLVAEGNINIIAKESRQIVKIEGDAIISVEGNMIQEVNGDMRQIVRGNYELSVGGQLNLNGSEEIQARAAKIRLESNVEGINLKAAKKINIQSGEVINIKSGQGIFQEAVDDINIKGDNLFIQGAGSTNIKSDTIFIEATGAGDFKAGHAKIGGGAKVSLSAQIVAADDIILLASGDSVAPAGAEPAVGASPAESTELPEPAEKGVGNGSGRAGGLGGGGYRNPPVAGSGGYISQDDQDEGNNTTLSTRDSTISDYVSGDFSDFEEALKAQGFTEREILASIAVASGESGVRFNVTEKGWAGSGRDKYDRIRSIFSRTKNLTDEQLSIILKDNTTFFNFVYNGRIGNVPGTNDGYNFRGRGFIQLTGRDNYARYAKITGYDIVNNPDLIVTDKQVSIAVSAAYLKDRVNRTGAGTPTYDPVKAVRTAVAGGGPGTTGYDLNINNDRAKYARLLKERGLQ